MNGIEAVIFDMDGVLIDSEPLWRTAMMKGFSEIGIDFTEEDCRKTTGMRFNEVVSHWFEHHRINPEKADAVNKNVIDHLIDLIYLEGKAMQGAIELLDFLTSKALPLGLATSSPQLLIKSVMHKINSHAYFNAIVSAELLQYGKPHPEVFLKCADELQVPPSRCLVIEDSFNGIISAKAAGMKVIAMPDSEHMNDQRFIIADYRVKKLTDIIKLF